MTSDQNQSSNEINNTQTKMDTNEIHTNNNDDAEETSSTSSNGKLKIDIGDDSSSNNEAASHQAKKIRTKTPEKQPKETPPAAVAATTPTPVQPIDTNENASGCKTSGRRSINKGLDGGYWSRIATAEETSTAERRKRSRVPTERLDLSVYKHNVSADESIMSDDTALVNAASLDSDGSEINSKTTTTSVVTSKRTSTSPHQTQNRLFKAKSFLTVRNETDGFYLCRAVNAVYEESKRCKVQWLEDVAPNKYKFSVVDYIQPMSIITKVSVKHCAPSSDNDAKGLISIEEKDLERVTSLLEKIKESGHLTVDSSELDDSDQQTNSDEASTKASGSKRVAKFFDNDEFFDKEDEDNK